MQLQSDKSVKPTAETLAKLTPQQIRQLALEVHKAAPATAELLARELNSFPTDPDFQIKG